MFKKFGLGILFSILFFSSSLLFPTNVYSVSINLSMGSITITEQPFEVNVEISGPNDGTNYLRVDIYKDGSSNYFGETFNGTSWVTGSDGTKYFPVEIKNSSASASVKGKIGTPSAGQYPGSGNYKLRIRRYTSSGNPANNDTQTPLDVNINYSFPTPTPDPTSPPTPVPTPVPTLEPTPTKSLLPKPTKTLAPTTTPEVEVVEVLGEQAFESPSASPESQVASSPNKKALIVGGVFIFLGIVMVGFSVYQIWKKSKTTSEKNNI